MDDLLCEFLTETTESLDVVDVELVKFEQEPNNSAILDNIFRLVHTIKGTCGFLGLPRLEALAHAAETLMGKFRDGMAVTPEAVTLILASIDQIKVILGDLEQNETEPEGSDSELIAKLDLMSLGEQAAASAPKAEMASPAEGPEATDVAADVPLEGDAAAINVVERETKPGEVSLDDLERAFQEAEAPEGMDHTVPTSFEPEDTAKPEESAVAEAPPEPEPKEDVKAPEPAAASEAAPVAKKDALKNQSIRVNVDTIEHLITMVSELVLTRNQLLEIERQHVESKFKVPLQRLSNVTAELQEGVMKTRMQPIGNAWQKLPRIVRDLAQEVDKKIELVMNGAATELDRQVLELIKDPLTHMVRNSADHGLETTQGRIDAGKPEVGTITLSAFHEGGYIIIEIVDDGRGLNTAKLRNKILENGIITEAEMDKLSEAQIHNFVFNAGLSTAEKVTSVSGRGVGMDVVRTNIELIGGSIELKSTEGVGTTFKIKIPLTLAIVSALIVESSGTRYAIPQLSVIELVRAQSDSDHRIEMIKDTPVLRLRNKLLPLIHLNKLLQVEKPVSNVIELDSAATKDAVTDNAANKEGSNHDDANDDVPTEAKVPAKAENNNVHENGFIVVTQVGSQNFGIVVDAVFHTEEIVVKPMSSMLRDIAMFSGNTILGDGSVIMIIDPNGIAQTVGADISEEEDKAATAAIAPSDSERTTSMLLFRSQSGEHKAVPLALVTRLEETSVNNIEASNDRFMIQYREQLMPLVYIDPTAKPKEEGVQQFLVFADNERSMGLAVEEIVDIVDEKLDIQIASDNDGVLGSAVIKGKATEVVDIAYYLPQAFADWFERKEFDQGKFAKKVLLVDDSAFFRNMLSPVLKASGYAVTSVDSAREALELRNAGVKFDVIVSDIEMPDMNGFEFAESLRNDDVWGNIPLIALSSHCSEAALERGRQAGFHDYVAKFDREGLIETLRQSHVALGEAA